MELKNRPRTGNVKPQVAFRSQERAIANIEVKLLIIYRIAEVHSATISLEGLEKARATELLKQLPITVRQFNAWTGPEDFPYEQEIVRPKRNAQETLHNCGLLDKVQHAVKLVKNLCAEFEKPTQKVQRLASAIRRAKAAEELRSISEKMLVKLKRENEALRQSVADLEIQLNSLKRESRAIASKADALTRSKRINVSLDSAVSSNVSPLRSS